MSNIHFNKQLHHQLALKLYNYMLSPIIVPETYPSTSFPGATAFVQADGSMGSDESGGSCTIMP